MFELTSEIPPFQYLSEKSARKRPLDSVALVCRSTSTSYLFGFFGFLFSKMSSRKGPTPEMIPEHIINKRSCQTLICRSLTVAGIGRDTRMRWDSPTPQELSLNNTRRIQSECQDP